jgi:hypothetical protein
MTPLSALEQSMGLLGASTPADMEVVGLPESDPDETPPGRAAVSYSLQGDALFAATPEEASASEAGNGSSPIDDELLGGGLLNLLGGGGAEQGALIRQLEAMAEEFEEQSGVPEVEIRAKIAMLRNVFEARDTAVAAQRSRMESALAVLDTSDHASPTQANEQQLVAAAASGEAAAFRASLDVATSLEASLGRVDQALATDPDTLSMVGGIMRGAHSRSRSEPRM